MFFLFKMYGTIKNTTSVTLTEFSKLRILIFFFSILCFLKPLDKNELEDKSCLHTEKQHWIFQARKKATSVQLYILKGVYILKILINNKNDQNHL